MSRRQSLLAMLMAAAGGAWPSATMAKGASHWRQVPAPGKLLQIAAGGPTGLLGVAASGALLALPVGAAAGQGARSAEALGADLDPHTPLALGHGRIAARRLDGALWVREGAQLSASAPGLLAPGAGLLVLGLAVIGIEARSPHHAVRLEAAGGGSWAVSARSEVAVLPDARPLQADLDGTGDGGQVVVLAGPDDQRYRHGVLGDAIEATQLVLLERHSLSLLRSLVVPAPHVLEDIAPRRVQLHGRAQGEGLLSVRAGPQGGQLVLIDADPVDAKALRLAAVGPPIGRANRWLSPVTDGRRWLAVHTPHIGGELKHYAQQGDALVSRSLPSPPGGVSNHRLGSRTLDISAWQGAHLVLPDQAQRQLQHFDAAADWRHMGTLPLPARVLQLVALADSLPGQPGMAALLEDGTVMAGGLF